jgi:ABC-2 type transport system ATP-binding protein
MSEQIVLAAERARVRFGDALAVNDVSFNLHGGQLLGLIGPNGAGKTTLLRALTGTQLLTSGVVRVLGEPLTPTSSHLKQYIGFTPDTPSLYEDLTVREFLTFVSKGYDLEEKDANERIDFWLEKVWLTEKADNKIKQLSRGMRQRVGIARTLLPNSAIVLLDEPSAGLDPAGRVQFRQLLCNLREQGKAIIVSSHILLDMAEYCTHIGIMSKGQLVRYGTVAEVSNEGPAHRCRYTVQLARPVASLKEIIESIEDVSHVSVDTDEFTLEGAAGREPASQLLAQLMAKNLPIASFAAHSADLEEAYLRTDVAQVD